MNPGDRAPRGRVALGVGLVALVAWIALAVAAPALALRGWWSAFTFVSGPAIGSLVLLMIRRLVGGDWGDAFAPELEPAARGVGLVALFAAPVALVPALVFAWAAVPSALDPQVRRFYLNPAAFAVRQVVFLGGLTVLAWRLPKIDGPRGRLAAGLSLVFYGVGVTLISVDWTLSLQTGFTNSASGMGLATEQMAAALAWCALQGRARPSRAAAGDLGALLFATLLGLTYLAFVDYLVVWYGDRPVQSAWYVSRAQQGWRWLAIVALNLGFVVPSALLLVRRALGDRRALFAAGAFALTGLAAFALWEHAPAFGMAALASTGVALIAQAALFVGVADGWPRLSAMREAALADAR